MGLLRQHLRGLRRQPGFTISAVVTLALGIAATTAIFSVVYAVLFRPLPYKQPERLAVILSNNLKSGDTGPVAPANYYDLRAASKVFETIGAAEAWSGTFTGAGEPEQVPAMRTTASLFAVLGVKPAIGRPYAEEEEEPGRHRVLVLSHGLWQRRFGGDRSVVGRQVLLSGEPFEIIGVMPESFYFAPFWHTKAEMWSPLAFAPERRSSRTGSSLRVFGRLRADTAFSAAQAEAANIASQLTAHFPDSNTNRGFDVRPMHEAVTGRAQSALYVLLGAVGLVLLIACANVANLLLARGVARRRELAVRAALGASPGHLLKHLLGESLILAVIGGICGLILAIWAVDVLKLMLADGRIHNSVALPRAREIAVSPAVLLFTSAVTILTALAFGLLPAIESLRRRSPQELRAGRGTSGGRESKRIRSLLIGAEVALTTMLLVGAVLLSRSFYELMRIDPGFRTEYTLTAVVNAWGSSVAQPESQVQFYQDLAEKIGADPTVLSVGLINHLPLAGDTWSTPVLTENQPNPRPGETPTAVYRIISPGYFQTVQASLLRGRNFESSDVPGAVPVTIVNETLARRHFPNADAVGKRLRPGVYEPWLTIVGVVRDLKQRDWTANPEPEFYLPLTQAATHFRSPWSSSMAVVVRGHGDPHQIAPVIRKAAYILDKGVPVSNVMTLDEIVSGSVRQPRMIALLMGCFAALALILAAVGLYGVIAYSVSQRTQEIGVRVALGAGRQQVLALVVGQGLKLAVSGIAAGLAGAAILGQQISGVLYGVTPGDPLTGMLVAAVLLLISLAAAYIPARRALRVNPTVALRYE